MRKDEYKNIYRHQDKLWWYRGMAEIQTVLLKKYVTRKQNSILDAGCGTGAAFGFLSKFGNVTGVDLSDEALFFSQKLGNVKKSDIKSMPFASDHFDIVTCLDVLYHRWVEDWRLSLKEFYRVLKPGGILLIREPAYNWFRGSHDKVDFTKHRFIKDELEGELVKAGFKLKKITSANFFLFPIVFIKRLAEMIIPRGKPVSDRRSVHSLLNIMLFSILQFEAKLIKVLSLPWGSSVICVAQKKNGKL